MQNEDVVLLRLAKHLRRGTCVNLHNGRYFKVVIQEVGYNYWCQGLAV